MADGPLPHGTLPTIHTDTEGVTVMSRKTKACATNRTGRRATPHRKGCGPRSRRASYVRWATTGQAEGYTIQAQLNAIRQCINPANVVLSQRHIGECATGRLGKSKPE